MSQLQIIVRNILLVILLVMCGVGAVKAEEESYTKFAVLAVTNCVSKIEWVIIVGPEGYRAIHYTEADGEVLKSFLTQYPPVYLRPPAGVCI